MFKKIIMLLLTIIFIIGLMVIIQSCPAMPERESDDPGPMTTTTYEAEDGECGNGAITGTEGDVDCVKEMHNPEAFNEISNVNGGAGGSVTLVIVYATGCDDAVTKSLYVNDVDVQQIAFTKGDWTEFIESEPITITLKSGTTNKIKLQNDADDNEGVNIDKYIVSTSSSDTSSSATSSSSSSSSSGGDDGKYEAEDGTIGDLAEIRTEYGVVCVGGMHNQDAWNEVTVNSTGGSTTLTIRYACGESDVNKNVYINGTLDQEISFDNNGWDTWNDKLVTVTLTAGSNTIKIKNDDGSDGVNLDYYTIDTDTTPVSSSSTTPPSSSSSSTPPSSSSSSTPPSSSSSSTPPSSSSSSTSTEPGVYQAEDGTVGGLAEVITEEGVICVGQMHNTGAWNEVTVDGGAGGSTTLTITYGCGENGVTKNLYINGALDQLISFSNVGWAGWTDKLVTITLTAGSNTIKIQNDDGSNGVNLDKYEID